MNPTNTDNITCIIFGHNFYKSQHKVQGQSLIKCKNCNTIQNLEEFDNSYETKIIDNTFKNALRRLFLLKRNVA